jgi:hypothetical protein
MPAFSSVRRTCEACGAVFLAKPSQVGRGGGRFCSRPCSDSRPRQTTKVQQTCEACGRLFLTKASEIVRGRGKFCSRDCWRGSLQLPPGRSFLNNVGEPTETGCILWTGPVRENGYGIIQHRPANKLQVVVTAHRLAFELAYGPIPAGMQVMHLCDVPGCVNPLHLALGTAADNMADKVAKGRQRKGESCNLSKLSEERVRDIRTRYAAGGVTQKQLAEEHHISISNVIAVLRRHSWKHVT